MSTANNDTQLRLLWAGAPGALAEQVRDALQANRSIYMEYATNRNELSEHLQKAPWDVVICAHNPSGLSAREQLENIRAIGTEVPVIVAFEDMPEATLAVEIMRKGAEDILTSRDLNRAPLAVEQAQCRVAARQRRRRFERFSSGQAEVLEMILRGESLAIILSHLARKMEAVSPAGTLICITLTATDEKHLELAAAPSLPIEIAEALRSIPISNQAGTCGLAAALGEPVIVQDTGTHPIFEPFRPLITRHGLRSAWSVPVIGSEEKVLGTIGIFSPINRHPNDDERRWAGDAAKVVSLAIERTRAGTQLRESERRLQALARATNDALWEWDLTTNEVHWNEGLTRLFGYKLEDLPRDPDYWTTRIHPEDREGFYESLQNSIRQGEEKWVKEYRFLHAGGAIAHVLDRAYIIRDAAGRATRVVGGVTDLTDHKSIELSLARSNRALQLLSAFNEALIRADNEQELLAEACRLAVDIGGYPLSWVGFAPAHNPGILRPTAHSGTDTAYVQAISLVWNERTPSREGAPARILSSGQSFQCADVRVTPGIFLEDGKTWREEHGGLLLLPLETEDQVFGVMALHTPIGKRPRDDETDLLRNLADDLAYGIQSMRSRRARRQLESAVIKVASSVSSATGSTFFHNLARDVTEALGVRGAGVVRTVVGEPGMLQTIGAWIDGKSVDNLKFTAADTPCAELFTEDEVVIPADLRRKFPSMPAAFESEAFVGRCLINAQGNPVGCLFILFSSRLEDTTFAASMLRIFAARAAAEISRAESEARIHEQASLLDKAQDAIIVRTLDHRIEYWNKGAENLFGWTAEEIRGKTAFDLLPPETDAFEDAQQAVLRDGEWIGELEHVSKSGKRILAETRLTLIESATEGTPQILSLHTNITERKQLERQLLRAQRMESIGTLAGGIAHDLNNVLAPISMAIDLLRSYMTEPRCHRLLETIASSAKRGADMVGQVLSFARGMDGRRIEVQVRHILNDVHKILRETFPKNIDLKYRVQRDLSPVRGDPTQIHQVLLNLCVNARDAMESGGTLSIFAGNVDVSTPGVATTPDLQPGPYAMIQVSDTGCGIDPAHLEQIFDPFFTTKEIGKGTGLGLSTSQAIVRSHGGFFRVESTPGQGTTFSVYFPTVTQAKPAVQDNEAIALPIGNQQQILVIDDEAAIREITKDTLETYGYRVLLAANGAEGVSLYQTHRTEIEAVIVDMMMPVMDGTATVEAILDANPAARIIAVSGISGDRASLRAVRNQVHYFLTKPYSTETLLTSLHEMLSESTNKS
ncbi:MAG: PAS domain S-box protein [Opitutales bacterium]|nr:PAS domain S-box protein [Opitutales bacterium]